MSFLHSNAVYFGGMRILYLAQKNTLHLSLLSFMMKYENISTINLARQFIINFDPFIVSSE